jgi:Lon protease-like protein
MGLPEDAPVMVLPNAVLVPHALLPLHIFEPQYREMLSDCLERNRLFCIALQLPGATDAEPANFHRVGGIGLVRACVGCDEGTSNLILQGLARVRFGKVLRAEPFRVVEIGEFETECGNEVEAEALGVKVVEMCGQLQEKGQTLPPALIQKLRYVHDPELIADIVTQTFLRDPMQQQRLMEETVVAERMRMLIRFLSGGGGKL